MWSECKNFVFVHIVLLPLHKYSKLKLQNLVFGGIVWLAGYEQKKGISWLLVAKRLAAKRDKRKSAAVNLKGQGTVVCRLETLYTLEAAARTDSGPDKAPPRIPKINWSLAKNSSPERSKRGWLLLITSARQISQENNFEHISCFASSRFLLIPFTILPWAQRWNSHD